MVWTTPRTWVTGEVVSASWVNTFVGSNHSTLYNIPRFRATNTVAPDYEHLGGLLVMDQERYDSDNMYSPVSAQCFINSPGAYCMGSAWSHTAVSNSGIREVKTYRDSEHSDLYHTQMTVSQNQVCVAAGSSTQFCTLGESVTFAYYHNHGSTLTGRKVDTAYPEIWGSWVGG